MSKYLPFSRRKLRAMFWSWIGDHRRVILTMVLITLAMLVFETVVFTTFWQAPANPYAMGLLHAVTLAAFAQIVITTFFAHNPAAIGQLRGAWGEDNTRDVLKRAKRKRLIWGSVDGVDLQRGDIDHLVVTRHGGLVAIDSKWRAESFSDVDQMARAADKVRLRAEALTQTVLDRDRGTHRASTNPLKVRSVIVLWGSSQSTIPDGASRAGIEFIAGRRLIAWLKDLDGESIDKDAARDLLGKLEGFRETAWGQESASRI